MKTYAVELTLDECSTAFAGLMSQHMTLNEVKEKPPHAQQELDRMLEICTKIMLAARTASRIEIEASKARSEARLKGMGVDVEKLKEGLN